MRREDSIRALVDDLQRRRAADPAFDPGTFLAAVPDDLRDEVEARYLAHGMFGDTPPVHPAQVAAGTMLGDFRLLRELGRGGMGVVFLAEQVALQRQVALKVLAASFGATSDQVASFRREATAVARLQHPGIVRVHTVGEASGVHFFAMDFVDGQSLRQRLDALAAAGGGASLGVLPGRGHPAEVAELGARVAEALAFAHRHGLVHRDVKPQNILLGDDGSVRLVDFGLAKDLAQTALTRTGELKGTPLYMSPEQVQADPAAVDERTDVYSLGVVLYECLTRRRPFSGTSVEQVLHQIVTVEPPAVRRLAPEVPRDLETICHRAIEKNPRRRYRGAAELAADLRRFLQMAPIAAVPAGAVTRAGRWVVRHRATSIGAAVALVALAVYGVATAMEGARQRAEAHGELEAADALRRAGKIEAALQHALRAAALRPYDREVRAGVETFQELWAVEQQHARLQRAWAEGVQMLGRSTSVLEADPGQALVLAAAAAQQAPALLADTLSTNDALLAALRKNRELRTFVGHREAVGSAALDVSGTRVVTAGDDWTARLFDAESGDELAVLQHADVVHAAVFDPRGERIATACADRRARVFRLGDRQVVLVLAASAEVRCLAFSPDGDRVATGAGDGSVAVWDAATGALLRTFHGHTEAVRAVQFSADGRLLVTAADDRTFRVVELPSGVLRFASLPAGSPLTSACFTPDAAVVVTSGASARCIDIATGKERWRLPHAETVVAAAFAAVPARCATACVDGVARVFDCASGECVATLRGHHGALRAVTFARDGSTLLTSADDGTARLWSLAPDPGAGMLQSHRNVRGFAFSPDGASFAAAMHDGTVRIGDSATGGTLASWKAGDVELVPPVVFDVSGQRLLAAASDRTVRLYDRASGREAVLSGHAGAVTCARFDPAGATVATCALDDALRTFDARDGRLIARATAPGIRALEFADRGQRLIGVPAGRYWSEGEEHEVPAPPGSALAVWSAADLAVLAPLPRERVYHVTAGPNSDRLLVATLDAVVLLALRSEQPPVVVAPGLAHCAAFSRDGRTLAVGLHDGRALLVDGTTGEVRATLRGHADWIGSVAFSPAGDGVLTASLDRTARIWNVANAVPARVIAHDDAVVECAWSPCGRYVATRTRSGELQLAPARLLDVALARVPRRLSLAERERLGLLDDMERRAHVLVERLFAQLVVAADVEARLRGDLVLDEPLRAAALAVAAGRADRPWRLEQRAWGVVRDPAAGDQAWREALRIAEVAQRLAPEQARCARTLGAALFRLGRDAEAEPWLVAAAAKAPHLASAWAFLALVHHRQGHAAQACAARDRLGALPARDAAEAGTLRAEVDAAVAGPAKR